MIEPGSESRGAPFGRADLVALLVLLLLAGVLRFASLSDPSSMVFDEVYYAKDACNYVLNDEQACEGRNNEVHPPVGKWLIGAGIKAFGFDSLGWRAGPAVAGIVTVALLYLIARRLFGSWVWASIAAGLLALDPLHLVQSRISMLDVFLPMFGLASVLFLLMDRDRLIAGPADGALFGRPWRSAAGLSAALAVSTKWTGGFFLALALVLSLVWDVAARRRHEDDPAAGRQMASLALWFVAIPIVVYIVAYAGQVHGKLLGVGTGSWISALIDHHEYMWNFHTTLQTTHGYQSPPWSWILIKRPVSYFFCSGEQCNPAVGANDYQEIFATGSPLVWWMSIAAILGVAIVWARRRDFARPEGVILAGVLFTYGPWLVPGSDRPAVFIFYLLPTVPFMLLALTYWMQRISVSWEGRAATALFCAGAAALFVFYLPLLTKKTLPREQWQQRIWKFDNCDKPAGPLVTTTVTVTEGDEVRESTTTNNDNSSLPPNGWCWI